MSYFDDRLGHYTVGFPLAVKDNTSTELPIKLSLNFDAKTTAQAGEGM